MEVQTQLKSTLFLLTVGSEKMGNLVRELSKNRCANKTRISAGFEQESVRELIGIRNQGPPLNVISSPTGLDKN